MTLSERIDQLENMVLQLSAKVVDLTKQYSGITNHAHVELYKLTGDNWIRLNPTRYIP